MNKILVTILLAFFGVINVNAQEIDSLQIKSDTISIESLAARLDKLQHDYDYLKLDFELNRMQFKLEILANNIKNYSTDLEIDCYHYSGRYMKEICSSSTDNYNISVELLNSLKETITQLKAMVAIKVISSDFTEDEINLLNRNCNTLDLGVRLVERALSSYKTTIDWFKDKSSILN
ncbi:MAG: hypothetical protein J6A72_06250 [Alistipes sp.]|nr:hypothetical protein [Alistipes sp.]